MDGPGNKSDPYVKVRGDSIELKTLTFHMKVMTQSRHNR